MIIFCSLTRALFWVACDNGSSTIAGRIRTMAGSTGMRLERLYVRTATTTPRRFRFTAFRLKLNVVSGSKRTGHNIMLSPGSVVFAGVLSNMSCSILVVRFDSEILQKAVSSGLTGQSFHLQTARACGLSEVSRMCGVHLSPRLMDFG